MHTYFTQAKITNKQSGKNINKFMKALSFNS